LVDAVHVRSYLHESTCKPNCAKHFEMILFSVIRDRRRGGPLLARVFHSPLAIFSTSPNAARTRLTARCSRFADFENRSFVNWSIRLDHKSPMLECSARRFACGARPNADSLRHLHPPVCRTPN
jgi:hypothetical protein